MESELYPFEFLVHGTPLSLQAKNRANLESWKAKVQETGISHREEACPGFFLDPEPLAAWIFYFAPAPIQGDVDNIVKPILDALKGVAYLDDRQLERVTVQKFEPETEISFVSPTKRLAEALEAERPTVYVRISNDLRWREVKW